MPGIGHGCFLDARGSANGGSDDSAARPLMLVQVIATFVVIATIVGFVVTSGTLFGALESVVGGLGTASGVPTALIAAVIVSLGAGAVVAWRLSSELT